jgi:hypothetical protein
MYLVIVHCRKISENKPEGRRKWEFQGRDDWDM